jgi:hypothetical protein
MVALAVWVAHICFRIELLNARADHWLSRPESHDPDVKKWRASGDPARDELREWVGSWGVLQYLLTPFAILLAVAVMFSRRPRWQRFVAGSCGLISIGVAALTFYRGYLSALGS